MDTFFSNIKQQIIKIIPTVIFSFALAIIGTGSTITIAELTGNPIWKLAKDPAQVIGFQPYIGMLSNWGALLWMSTSVICLFSSMILFRNQVSFQKYKFILASGILSFILAIDDMFLLHDQVLPHLLNLPEFFFYFIYILSLGGYIVYFRKDILRYDYFLFIFAFLLFGISRRLFNPFPFLNQFMTTNDMLKHFGIVFWLAFFYRATLQELSEYINKKA